MRSWHLLFTLCSVVSASWATHYAFGTGRIYVQLTNNDLVALTFSATGYSSLSSESRSQTNIQTGDGLQPLSSPPQNSSLFVHNSTLYAVTGAQDTSLASYDPCGDGVFQLLQYNDSEDAWFHPTDQMTFTNVEDVSFYADSTYLLSPTSSTIYIFGGRCASTGSVSSRLLALDLDTMEFSNITTASQPSGFYGGASVWAPTPQTSFVIGGRSGQGWLNMYQLATWDFSAGWSFQEIVQNGTTISSRVDPLVLPVFDVLSGASLSTFTKEYSPKEVLVVGGTTAGSDSTPWARLSYSDNAWTWTALDAGIDTDDILGAAVIFNTLVTVRDTSASKRELGVLSKARGATRALFRRAAHSGVSKRSAYSVSLYNVDNGFAAVSDVVSNTATARASASSAHTTAIVVGTVVPVFALLSAVAAALYLWRRHKTKAAPAISEPLDYQLGHFRTASEQPYSLLGARPLDMYQHQNETSSTLDVASMDSWVRKRQEYEARARPLRDSYLASTDTLNLPTIEDEPRGSDSDGSGGRDGCAAGEAAEPHAEPIPGPGEPDGRGCESPAVARLKQTFSYTQTPPQSPLLKKRSRLDPGFLDLAADADTSSLDENVDVQVLVSSKRKSVLRVVNPDSDAESAHASGDK